MYVKRAAYADFPGTLLEMSSAGERPTLTAAQKNQDLSLTTWVSTAIVSGDILSFEVFGIPTVEQVTLTLNLTK